MGVTHRELVPVLTTLGEVYIAVGKSQDACQHLKRGVEPGEAELGQHHREVARVKIQLGMALWSSGEYTTATALMQEVVQIFERDCGRAHRWTRHARSMLSEW